MGLKTKVQPFPIPGLQGQVLSSPRSLQAVRVKHILAKLLVGLGTTGHSPSVVPLLQPVHGPTSAVPSEPVKAPSPHPIL